MSAVLSGLCRSLPAVIASRRPPAGGRLSFPAGSGLPVVRFASAGGLCRLARRGSWDVINLHFSGWPRPWLLGLEKALASSGARLVVTFQDFEHPELPRGTAAQRTALRRLLRRADTVTAVSAHLRDRVEASLPGLRGKVLVVPNGVGLPAPRAGRRPPARRPYILSVGRLAPYKGTDLLLMAYSQLKDPKADLVLCGAPFHEDHARGLIAALRLEGRVHLTGLQSPARVAALLEGCLFYAAAPRTETFGMAVVEAMAAGKAVLAARVGAIPEYLRDGKEGLLAEPKDVAGLRRGLERLLGDAALRRRLGAGARRAARRFSWDRVAGRYLDVYR